jgi:UDP-glucose 4-epimerase
MEYCIIIPHNIYGPKQNIWDPYRNVLGIWMYQSLQKLPMTIYGDGEQSRSFSYIEDILPCLWNAAVYKKAKNERINLGGKYKISLNNAVKIMSEITENKDIKYLENRHEVKHAWCRFEKSELLLDYDEKTNLKQGILKMWEWAKTQKQKQRKFFKSYELDKNIYSFWKLDKNIYRFWK